MQHLQDNLKTGVKSKPMPKISVIVPNFNHAHFLRRRIDTILTQTFQDFELILLDDCSTDESPAILREYASDPRVRLDFNKVNSGSTFKQWNKGVRLARGKYVWIAESDDYAGEQLLERLVAVLEHDPEVAFAYCLSWGIDRENKRHGFADRYLRHLSPDRWRSDFVVDGREECRNYFVRANVVPNASAVVFRRAIYEEVGGADESLRVCGDWKLWAAMALTGRIAYLGEPLNYFRFHDASVRITNKYLGVDVAEHIRVIRWLLGHVTPTQEVQEKLWEMASIKWVPVVMSAHVPQSVKWSILRDVLAIDPHPLRRAIRPALETVRLKFLRHVPFARQKDPKATRTGIDVSDD
jgi:glycosyltransferase involved in cell wall biosynthesis